MKKALITGITGMDGSHMADLLLSKGYEVYGLERHKSVPNHQNILHIENQIHLIQGDLRDQGSLIAAVDTVRPDEIYNFAAESTVGFSQSFPEMAGDVIGIGVLRLLEAVRQVDTKIRIHQASSSEMFRAPGLRRINETAVFYPRNPYAVAKVYGHLILHNYREMYNIFGCSAICFNHESERRGFEFVTRKITCGVARIQADLQDKITLGTLDVKRDWGYAPDFCEGAWLMLQQQKPDDYVFSTGTAHSIRDFVQEAFQVIGIKNWQSHVELDPTYMRPANVDYLIGDSTKAEEVLGWKSKVTFKELVKRMVENDMRIVKLEQRI